MSSSTIPPAPHAALPAVPLLDVRGLTVSFAGRSVVHGIDFSVAAGEKLAIVGESGSGKTVTALSLLRLVSQAQVQGTAALHGRDLIAMPEEQLRGVRGRDVAVIFQEPMTALNPLFTVGDQIAEVVQLKQGLDKAQAWQRAVQLLARTGIAEPERRAGSFAHQLSGGQRQRAMIAMAIANRPQLLLADEPTTALDVSLRRQMLDLLDDLRAETGMAIVLITHDLNLVRRFADRVAVMEQGHIVEQGEVSAVFAAPSHPYTRRLVDSRPTRLVSEDSDQNAAVASAGSSLNATNLVVTFPTRLPGFKGWFRAGAFIAVDGVDFSIPSGRTLGVIGESGSGKSTLAQAALALLPFQGEVRVGGQAWAPDGAARRQQRRTAQIVFQDPFSSLSPRMTLEEIVGEGLRVFEVHLAPAQRRERVQQALAEVGLSEAEFPGLLQRYPHQFSGGQRQRIAIARALIVQPTLLVLDEPTSALDVTIQKQVLELLARLQAQRGLSYLLITHDVDVVRALAHAVLVLKDGKVVESGATEQVLGQPQAPYTQLLVQAAAS